MKLKITSCSDPLMWYRDSIGHVVPFLGEENDYKGPIYWSRDNDGYKNIILKKDAELINSEEANTHQQFDQASYPQ